MFSHEDEQETKSQGFYIKNKESKKYDIMRKEKKMLSMIWKI